MDRKAPMDTKTPLRCAARSRNEKMILEIVRRLDPVQRSAITGHTNLTQQSVHRIVEDLMQEGLLQAGQPEKGLRGQPSPRMMLNREAAFALGISINTDSASLTLLDMACHIREEVRMRVRPMSRSQTLAEMKDILHRMLERNGVSFDKVVGLGVGISGFFIADRRQVNAPEPLRDWSLIDLAPIFEDAFSLPVRIENNATTASVAELLRGVGRRCDSFAYLSFNYGFGGGIVIDGRLLLGKNGNAGEIGGIYTPEEGENRPALRYLLDEVRSRGVSVDSIEDLSLRFDLNWPGVAEWVERVSPPMRRMVNALAAILDPQAIVFGGQIPPELARMLMARAEFWTTHRYDIGPSRPELLLSEVAGDAASSGAAMLILREAFFD
ncbi:ROK family protein [Allorhizobium sp. BGMRC 0089]|uniref:ROK family protein n=1 Tax=Allorhizobium sonneratiae TaxID=2934936 RepID=UPI00203403D8|nr:ROK family protein [Allorhizobium sonneratiae]MCM2293907.1 ROK family protein [Allorhizobium sonneratiae]